MKVHITPRMAEELAGYERLYPCYGQHLSQRERLIVEMRFKMAFPYDFISRYVGVTPERIRQIIDNALRKMRRMERASSA